jgi:hypothetical protein
MAKAKPKVIFKMQIANDEWTILLWRAKPYIRMHGDDSGAITTPAKKLMEFRDDELCLEFVAHELFHAYFKYLHLDSTVSLKIDDVEEVIASWLGSNFQRFTDQANLIYAKLKGEDK